MRTPVGNVGYKRIIIIAMISTTFTIFLDKMGLIDTLANAIPGGNW